MPEQTCRSSCTLKLQCGWNLLPGVKAGGLHPVFDDGRSVLQLCCSRESWRLWLCLELLFLVETPTSTEQTPQFHPKFQRVLSTKPVLAMCGTWISSCSHPPLRLAGNSGNSGLLFLSLFKELSRERECGEFLFFRGGWLESSVPREKISIYILFKSFDIQALLFPIFSLVDFSKKPNLGRHWNAIF